MIITFLCNKALWKALERNLTLLSPIALVILGGTGYVAYLGLSEQVKQLRQISATTTTSDASSREVGQ